MGERKQDVYSLIKCKRNVDESLYSCGKPCSTRSRNEIMKKLTLFPAFDPSNHDLYYVYSRDCVNSLFISLGVNLMSVATTVYWRLEMEDHN